MNRALQAALVVASLVVCSGLPARAAEGPHWSYIEAGYLNVDPDNLSGSGDNWFGGISLDFLKNLHVAGRYVDGDIADGVEQSYWRVGVGLHGLLGEKADLLAEARWVDTEISNIGDDGYGITGGVRWQAAKFLELDAFVNYVDLDTAGSDTSYGFEVLVEVWRIGLGASYEIGDEADQWNTFVRFNFGKS